MRYVIILIMEINQTNGSEGVDGISLKYQAKKDPIPTYTEELHGPTIIAEPYLFSTNFMLRYLFSFDTQD